MISSNSEFLLKDYLQEHPHKLNQNVKLNFLVSDSVNLNYRYVIKNGSFPIWSTLTLEQKKILTFLWTLSPKISSILSLFFTNR